MNLWEKAVVLAASNYISRGDLVLDLGSNIGGVAQNLSELVGKEGNIICFEANPNLLQAWKEETGKSLFAKALLEGGYSESVPAKYENFDIWSESLFDIAEGFPRLTRHTIPDDNRILNLTYSIDLSGCDAFKSAEFSQKMNLGE